MWKIEKLKSKIKALSLAEQATFCDWYLAYEADRWDAQIEADAKWGKLDALAQQAVSEDNSASTRVL